MFSYSTKHHPILGCSKVNKTFNNHHKLFFFLNRQRRTHLKHFLKLLLSTSLSTVGPPKSPVQVLLCQLLKVRAQHLIHLTSQMKIMHLGVPVRLMRAELKPPGTVLISLCPIFFFLSEIMLSGLSFIPSATAPCIS